MKNLFFLLLAISFMTCHEKSAENVDNSIEKDTLCVEKAELTPSYIFQNTIVYPCKNIEILPGKNLIYCSSFEISWNKIRDDILKGPVSLNKQISWVDDFNKAPGNTSISPTFLFAFAGFYNEDIFSGLQAELKERFNFTYNPDINIKKKDLLSVAYLKKEIKFSLKLNEELGYQELCFNEKKDVDFFGRYGSDDSIVSSKYKIHDYINEDDFIFEIETTSPTDEVYLAKVTPEATLDATFQNVKSRINKGFVEYLGYDDLVKIPFIKFNIQKEFEEVTGARILNKEFRKYSIGRAIQLISFDLNESGIIVESFAETFAPLSFRSKEPKKLIFDKPFLIILKEKKKESPYFLMWVSNTEFMRETQRKRIEY